MNVYGTILTSLMVVGGSQSAIDNPQSAIPNLPGPRGPNFLHVQTDPTGSEKLLVLCEKSGSILRVNPASGEIETEAVIGESPFALTAHPDGLRLYVSCRRAQEVVELDARSLRTLRRFPLRGDPTGVAVSADGTRLYVGVHSLDQVAVIDLTEGAEIKRLAAGNGPEMVRLLPSEGRVYVTNALSNPFAPDQACRNEITVIDDASARVVERIILENANVGRWIDFTSDGSMALAAICRPKNLIPMVQVARGWVVTNGFAVLFPASEDRWGADTRQASRGLGPARTSRRLKPAARGERPTVQLLVDLPNQAFADPFGLVITPDDRKFYLSSAGTDTVLGVDLARLEEVAREALEGLIWRHADHLGLSRRYVTARIAVGQNPQALAVSGDGRWLYVANRLDDSISVVDTTTDRVVRTLMIQSTLGGLPADRVSRGERYFHSAGRTFQGQFACVSCHPDLGFDGLQYDLEPDGIGQNILDNRNLRGVEGTGPFKWIGSNPDIATQCGTRTAKWIARTGWLSSTQVVDLAAYIRSIKPVVNPYALPDGRLTDAQRRGKDLFERTTTNDGMPIPESNRCDFCHAGPKFADGRKSDVGTRGPRDTASEFDSAHLNNIFESAPYLHDGRAATLEEIWTKHNPDDRHGYSSDWTQQQLNDLVEYLKGL